MHTNAQVRKALLRIPNVAAFTKKYAHLGVAQRTVYRQREPDAAPMREHVIKKLATALVLEGLLDAEKSTLKPTKQPVATKRRERDVA